MGHRVLGVTVGADRVRVAVIETRLRRFELKAVYEVGRRAVGGDPPWSEEVEGVAQDEPTLVVRESPAAALARALVPAPSAIDSIVLAYPGERAFLRRLSFPFKEKARIDATLPFQMIGHVPVEPEDIHCAYGKIAVDGAGTDTLAVAVPIDDFAAFLGESRAQGLDAASVTVDGVCLLALARYLPPDEQGAPTLLVWAEGTQAEMVVLRGSEPIVVRSVGLGEPVSSGGEVSAAFLREVLLSTASASEQGASVGRVWVAGPDAESLAGPLGEALGLSCEALAPAMLSIPGAGALAGAEPSTIKAVALALTAVLADGPGALDLRTGMFRAEGTHGLFREHAGFFVTVLALFAVLGIAHASFRYVGLVAERDAGIQELKAYSARVLGQERTDFDAVLKTVKTVSAEEFQVFPAWTGVDTLNRLSATVMAIGKSKNAGAAGFATAEEMETLGIKGDAPYAVEFESFRVEPRLASVRGEAETIEVFDDFVNRLKADPCFHDVVTESTERIQFQRHQGWQRFSIRMTVDCAAKKAKGATK